MTTSDHTHHITVNDSSVFSSEIGTPHLSSTDRNEYFVHGHLLVLQHLQQCNGSNNGTDTLTTRKCYM